MSGKKRRYIMVQELMMKSPSKHEESHWGGLQMRIKHEKKKKRKHKRR
jgi:hypothetical protein